MFSAQVVALTLLFRSGLLRLCCSLLRRRGLFCGSWLRLCCRRARRLGLLGFGGRRLRCARCRRRCRRWWRYGCRRYRCGLRRLCRRGLGSGCSSGFRVKLSNGLLPMLRRPAVGTPFPFPNLVGTFLNLALIVMRHSLFPHRVFPRLQFSQKRQRYQPRHRSVVRWAGHEFPLPKPCPMRTTASPRTRRNRSRPFCGRAKPRCKAVGAPEAAGGRGVVTSNHNGCRENYADPITPTILFCAAGPKTARNRRRSAGPCHPSCTF